MVDKTTLLVVGGAMAGGLALVMLSGSAPAQIQGGSGGTKKEGATVTETITQPGESGGPIYNIVFESPGFPSFGGAGGFAPDPIDTIADVIAPGDPARRVYASTYLPGYRPPAGPTKKEQKTAERGFTSRTGGGEDERWIGGR